MKYSNKQYKVAVRRLKRCNNKIQNEKFINGIIREGRNIFDEIKKFRGQQSTVSSRIDNEVGSVNIAGHFAKKYSQLYNNVQNGEKLDLIRKELRSNVGQDHEVVLAKINTSAISAALRKLKPGKRDAIFDSTSD